MALEPIKFNGGGDLRCYTLYEEIMKVIHTRADKMPIPSILGVLDLVKYEIITE